MIEKLKNRKVIVIVSAIAATMIALMMLFTFSQYKAQAETLDQVQLVSERVDALYSDETHTLLADTATMELVIELDADIKELEGSEDLNEESSVLLEEMTVELNNAKQMIDLRDSANALFVDGILVQGSDIATVEEKATALNAIKPEFVATVMPTITEAKAQQDAINKATKLVNSLFKAEDRKTVREDVTREEYQATVEAIELVKDPAIKEQLQASTKVVDEHLTKKEEEKKAAEEAAKAAEAAAAKAEAEAAEKAAAEEVKKLEAEEAEAESDNAMGDSGGESGNNNGGGQPVDKNHPGNTGTDIYDVPTWQYYENYSILVEEDGHKFGEGAPVYRVIDVSEYQGTIDWNAVAANGVDGVILRATSYKGGSINEDDCFGKNYKGAKAAGLDVGVYVYSEADTPAEAKGEAEYLLSILNKYGITPGALELGVYYDIEDSSQASLSPSEIEDLALSFFLTIEEAGYTNNAIYSGKSFTENHLTTPYLQSKMGWVARYNDIFQYDYSKSTAEYLGWQYTSTSTVPGIKGNVDVNGFYKNPKTKISGAPTEETAKKQVAVATQKEWNELGKEEAS